MRRNHLIGRYIGVERGPLLICFGGMHGNEPAGVKAIELMIKMLEVEPITNPDFRYRGRFLGILGNPEAYRQRKRYITEDLNRMWRDSTLAHLQKTPSAELTSEQAAIKNILTLIIRELQIYQPDELIFLDLHTTSSTGGIFTLIPDDEPSVRLALDLPAPVIEGMLAGLEGTTLHFFEQNRFKMPVRRISFEAGHHDDPLSINRCIAAITCCMRGAGAVQTHDVESQHVKVLRDYSQGLPKLSQLIYRHAITPDDEFVMRPGFENFTPIRQGDILAYDRMGQVTSPMDGRILLPLYQKQGSDGYFLVQELNNHHIIH